MPQQVSRAIFDLATDGPSTGSVSRVTCFAAAKRLFRALLEDDALAEDLPRLEGYVLSRRLGRGGGGVVYLGHRAESERRLAREEGEFFPGMIVLLNVAEDIEARDLDDREALGLFRNVLDTLCEAAMNDAEAKAKAVME